MWPVFPGSSARQVAGRHARGGMLSLGRIGLDYLCINEGVVVGVGVGVVGQGVL